jgi:hypothetical protein
LTTMTNRGFLDACLRSINDYRAVHQAAPLKHNPVISTIAQSWADQMARTTVLGHNPNPKYHGERLGENCACKSSSDRRDFAGKEVAENWYNEVKNYDFRRHSGPNTGHFTQLVWQSSREIGLGRAQSRDGTWFVVANFYPAGNYIGRNAENVLPPLQSGRVTGTPPSVDVARPVPSRANGRYLMSSPVMSFRPVIKPDAHDRDHATSHPGSAGRYVQVTPSGGSGQTVVQRRQETRRWRR